MWRDPFHGNESLHQITVQHYLRKYPATIGAVMHDSTHTSQVRADGRVALWLTGLAFTAIHVAFSGRYGFHRDEFLRLPQHCVPWPEFWNGFQYYGCTPG